MSTPCAAPLLASPCSSGPACSAKGCTDAGIRARFRKCTRRISPTSDRSPQNYRAPRDLRAQRRAEQPEVLPLRPERLPRREGRVLREGLGGTAQAPVGEISGAWLGARHSAHFRKFAWTPLQLAGSKPSRIARNANFGVPRGKRNRRQRHVAAAPLQHCERLRGRNAILLQYVSATCNVATYSIAFHFHFHRIQATQ
jgi:hypothetical protein